MADTSPRHSQSRKNNKRGVFLLAFFLLAMLWQGILLDPRLGSSALATLPVAVGPDATLTTVEVKKTIVSTIAKNIGSALKKAASNAARTFATQIAYQTAIAIAEYDSGQPLFRTESFGKIIDDATDAAKGDFLDTAFQEAVGNDTNFDICNPRLDLLIPLVYSVQQEIQPRRPRCTWSQIKDNNKNYFTDPNFLNNFGASLTLAETDFGAYLDTAESLDAYVQKSKENKEGELELHPEVVPSSDTGTTKTPDTVIQEQNKESLVEGPKRLSEQQNDPARCDTLFCSVGYVFTSTLENRLAKRIYAGILKKLGGNTLTARYLVDVIKNYFGGGDGVDVRLRGTGAGISARDAFIDLAKPNLSGTGAVDVVSQLVGDQCPEDHDPEQCLISFEFGEAIRQLMSLNQALGREPFNEGQTQQLLSENLMFGYSNVGANESELQEPNKDAGISYSAMVILRKYRIIPVTWEIAAQYIAQYESRTYTLGELVDLYDDENSPFFHLIDPDWVFKAPATQCARSGFVEDVLEESCTEQPQDLNDLSAPLILNDVPESQACPDAKGERSGGREYDDVNADTVCDAEKDKKITCSRKRACVDQQSCIIEDENGNCLDFGYCVEEEDVWRFGANLCKPEFASCLVYTNITTGETASYLRRSLSINDCSSDLSVNCRGFCQDGDANQWNCTYNSTTGLQSTDVNKPLLFLNGNARQCDAAAEGCQQFIRTIDGSNLVSNSDFEEFGGTVEDASDDDFGFCSASSPLDLIGKPCSAQDSSECGGGQCLGWKEEGSTALRATLFEQSPALQIMKGSASEGIEQPIQTGTPLAERRFALSFVGYSPSSVCAGGTRDALACVDDDDCQGGGSCTVSNNAGTCPARVMVKAPSDGTTLLDRTIDYTDLPGNNEAFELQAGVSVTVPELQVIFYRNASCHYVIDKVKLQEIEPSQQPESYTVYGSSTDLLQLNKTRRSCDVESVGCKLYTPTNGDTPVPGIIRDNDQCKPEDVGCRAFQEMSTRNNFEKIFAKPEHASRTGKFCQKDNNKYGQSCKVNSDCDLLPGDGLCLPAISLVPQSAQSCSAQEVGCEEFTNLDTGSVAEAIQYFTKIRPCVKPDDAICKSYFTWEGSATTGFQLREYLLEEGNAGAPKRPVGVQAEPNTCDETKFRSGEDPNCQQFFDTGNNSYYGYFDETISCTNECHPLRNSVDNEVYMAAPQESTACSPQANNCREYKGNSGNNQRVVLDNNFRLDGDNLDWTGNVTTPIVSAESVIALSGFGSLSSGTVNSSIASAGIPANHLVKNRSYVASFWLKGAASGAGLQVYLQDASGDKYFLADADDTTPAVPVNISAIDWREFKVGPVTLDKSENEDVKLVFDSINGPGGGIYVSNIKVVENDSVYLIKKSYKTCRGEENCQTYDAKGKSYNLKTFTRLCKEEFLGCEALINTENSHQPTGDGGKARAQVFARPTNVAPSAAQNSIVVPEDSIEYVINDPASVCLPEDRGCKAVGLPTLGYQNNINSYATQYIVDNPDAYETIMCQKSQEFCQAYFGGQTGQTVEKFKTPNENVCEYKPIPGQSGRAWFIRGTETPCPTRFINTFPERHTPTGQVCLLIGECYERNGTPTGRSCLYNSECGLSEYCNVAEVQPVEPITPCSYVGDPVCGPNVCGYWVGSCPADQNTCTEFVDTQDRIRGDAESSYFYLNDDAINSVDCEQDGVNPKRGCVAFEDNGNTELSVNSNQYCSSDVTNALLAPDFYEYMRQNGTVCRNASGDCGNPNETCENLPTDSYKAPKACLACSTNLYTCNNGTDAPCCDLSGICLTANSAKTRVSCDDNSDCQTGETCQVGQIFCDANKVVKVDRDRICDKWLTCAQSSTVTDDFGRKTNICLKREICDAGADGVCSSRTALPAGNLMADADKDSTIQSRISNIKSIDRLSGMSRAGLKFDDDQVIQGYLPYSQMTEYGVENTEIEVPNSSFARKQGGADKMPPDQWYPVSIDGQDSAQVQTIRESTSTRIANKYMRLINLNPAKGGGAFTRIPDPSTLGGTTEAWVMTFKARRRTPSAEGQSALSIRLVAEDDPGTRAENEGSIELKDYWALYTVQLRNRGGNLAKHDVVDLEIRHAANTVSQDYVDIDDVLLKPVLVVQNLPDNNVTTFAASLLQDSNKNGKADPFTYIPGVAQQYDPDFGVYSSPTIHQNFNRNDDPYNLLGQNDLTISLGTHNDDGDGTLESNECTGNDCHGWITIDFGAAVLVNKDGNDIYIKESGGAPDECYTVELAGSDLKFALVPPPDPAFACDNNADAFGGAGRQSEIDIREVRDPAIADGSKAARYVRIRDVSLDGPGNDSGQGSNTPGTDLQWIKALSTVGRNNYVARSCRAYPTEKAELCQYRDLNTGVFQVGWEGYCVERHPTDPDWCLHWLPIDVIAGSDNVFVKENVSLTPAPLFYCADTQPKPLPVPLAEPARFVCVNDAFSVGPTCKYTFETADGDQVDDDDCFDEGNQPVGITPGKACQNDTDCGGDGSTQTCKNGLIVTAEADCAGGASENEGFKCSTAAVVKKPRAAALSLLIVDEDGNAYGEQGKKSSHPDAWALGVGDPPPKIGQYVTDSGNLQDGGELSNCDRIAPVDDDDGQDDNYLNRYCEDTYDKCLTTLKKYYDDITVLNFRDDGDTADICGTDNESEDSNDCTDSWGGSCYYSVDDNRTDDGDGCSEPDDWNDINSWSGNPPDAPDGYKDCGFEYNDYEGLDPQGGDWQKDEDYPFICSRLVQVVDDKGRGLPYASRVQGGLLEGPDQADDVSGTYGYNDGDGAKFIWDYAYATSCTPYGATPFIDSPNEIGVCKGERIQEDENGDPMTVCEVNPLSGSCSKRDPDVLGECVVTHAPLELYHPYNPQNSIAQRICIRLTLGNAHFACNRQGTDSDAPCRVCNNDSANPGRTCVQNSECEGGKCIPVSAGRVCSDDSRNKGANCARNADCPDGTCEGIDTNLEEQGTKAFTAAARRLQQLFALAQNEWVWNGSQYELNPKSDIDWEPPINECSGGRRQGTDQYCGVKPKVQNMTINEQSSGDIVLSSGNPQVTMRFEAIVDGDQGPIENIYIDWGDSTEPPQSNYEGTVHIKEYSCPITTTPNPNDPNGPPIAHCDTCPGDGQKIEVNGIWKCKYENYPKVRLKDTWRWCNVDGAENNGGCQLWDGYASSIIVGP